VDHREPARAHFPGLTHYRRKEYQMIPINLAFLVLAAIVVWDRFGPYAF
jgi:hypothetical protein